MRIHNNVSHKSRSMHNFITKAKATKFPTGVLKFSSLSVSSKRRKMRVYKKRTDRQNISEDVLRKAVSVVLRHRDEKGFSIRKTAKKYKMSSATLCRYIKRYEEGKNEELDTSDNDDDIRIELKKKKGGQVFDNENESMVIQYSLQYGRIMGGLRPKQIRYLAYQCATKYNLKYPRSWDKNKRTGEDWLTNFLKRKKTELTFLPPPRPLPKGVRVNKKEVTTFYENLRELYDQYEFKGNDVWNMDQIEASTVVNDGTDGSAEIITVLTAANAIGNSVPPCLIFPNEKYDDNLTQEGPIDCIAAVSENGLLTDEIFLIFLKHFVRCVKPDEGRPVLLLLDNHRTNRINITVLDVCRQEGIIMLSLPARCEHRLQPLDVCVFGSFKNLCSIYTDEWYKNHPGSTMTISDLPGIVRDSWIRSMTPLNVNAGFTKSGIYPLNPENYDDKDYEPFDGTHFLVCREERPTENIQPTNPMTINNNTQIINNPVCGVSGYQTPAGIPMMGDYSANMASMVWERNDHCGWSGVQGI